MQYVQGYTHGAKMLIWSDYAALKWLINIYEIIEMGLEIYRLLTERRIHPYIDHIYQRCIKV